MKKNFFKIVAVVFVALISQTALADMAKTKDKFITPPASAWPHTWWHWMNGNITKEGITADLEAMAKVGIGGAPIFNVGDKASVNIPAGPVDYMSNQWLELVNHAVKEAKRVGLEICMHNCAGWSSSGGPWVEPQYAMQTIVVSETHAQGPIAFAKDLAQPKANHGFYRDIAVLAFPTPKDDATMLNMTSMPFIPHFEKRSLVSRR